MREPDEVGPNREQMVLVTFPERKVTRRKGGTDISNTLNNGYTCNSGTPDPPHRSLPLVVSSYVWTRPHCQPFFSTLLPGCIYVSGLFEEAGFGFWPTLVELAICPLQLGL